MSTIFSRYCELLCCCCFPASSACKTTSKSVISLAFRRVLTTGHNKGWFSFGFNGWSWYFCFIVIFLAFDYNRKSSWRKSFTFIQRANFSLAPGKSPACRRANPAAPHTPEGSRPHLVETSIARDSRSASINRSRRRLRQINQNNDHIKK